MGFFQKREGRRNRPTSANHFKNSSVSVPFTEPITETPTKYSCYLPKSRRDPSATVTEVSVWSAIMHPSFIQSKIFYDPVASINCREPKSTYMFQSVQSPPNRCHKNCRLKRNFFQFKLSMCFWQTISSLEPRQCQADGNDRNISGLRIFINCTQRIVIRLQIVV